MSADHPKLKQLIEEALSNNWNYLQLVQELCLLTNQSIELIGQLNQRELQTLRRSWPFINIDVWLKLSWNY